MALQEQRAGAKDIITRRLQDAPYFVSNPTLLQPFVSSIEDSIFRSQRTAAAYREQLLAIVANIRQIKGNIDEFDPGELGSTKPTEILTKKQKAQKEKLLEKRAREDKVDDDTRIHCPQCNFPRSSRLNLNRMGLDNETLGSQYEYNFETMCQCGYDDAEVEELPDETSDSETEERPATKAARKEINAD